MADTRLEEAVNVVARRIIADQACNVEWSEYPEIGMGDWGQVVYRIAELVEHPNPVEFEAAYEFLVGRVDNTEASP